MSLTCNQLNLQTLGSQPIMLKKSLRSLQPMHWFLGGKGLGIQQGTSVWVGSPKSPPLECNKLKGCRTVYMLDKVSASF